MEDIDTQKLAEILGVLAEYKVASFKSGNVHIVMVPEDSLDDEEVVGFAPTREVPDAVSSAPAGYKSLFRTGFPKFKGIEK